MRKIWDFISSASQSRTFTILGVLIILAAIPITVMIAQRQQEVRQQAAGVDPCYSYSQSSCSQRYFCQWFNLSDGSYCGVKVGYRTCSASVACNDSSETCIYHTPSDSTPKCFTKNTGGMNSYCKGGDGNPNSAACRDGRTCSSDFLCKGSIGISCKDGNGNPSNSGCLSGYCNPSTLTCANPPSSGGSSAGTPAQATSQVPSTPGFANPSYTPGCNSITLRWNASSGATSYLIRQYNQAGVSEEAYSKEYETSSTSYNVTGLISNPLTAYFFNIYAKNSAGKSSALPILAATGACTAQPTQPPSCTVTSYSPALNTFCGSKVVTTNCGTSVTMTGTQTCGAGQTCSNNACVNATNPTPACGQGNSYCMPPGTTQCVQVSGNCSCYQGFTACTPTAAPTTSGGTTLNLTIGFNGIGTAGDNANPTGTGSNKNPQLTQRPVIVHILNGSNYVVPQTSATLTYNSSSGKYTGTANIAGTIQSGTYTVKIGAPGHLIRTAGTVSMSTGQTVTVPSVNLVVGDLDQNNKIDPLDYNIFLSCSIFGKDNKGACGNRAQDADFNSDGKVDQIDYNLFIRDYSVQPVN